MKSKQSLFEQIIAVSVRKVKQRSVAGAKDQFQLRMKNLPSKIKQLNADPYMFIFDALIEFPQQVDYTLIQYQNMMKQNFLNPDTNSVMLTKHFRTNLNNHSFRIIQIIMDIQHPNINFMQLFFQINDSIPMPENVLESLRFTGYRWLSRVFSFRQLPTPSYINQLISGILKSQLRNLPTIEDQQRSRTKYIQKMLKHMTLTIQNNLKPQNQRVQSKNGICFQCFKPADFYCKDTKVSICSSDCKKAHINYINNNSAIDFQYSQNFKKEVQKLLYLNLKKKKNVTLSIDYLCAIYMNSIYIPQQTLPHRDLFISPIIVQRIWILYTMYYLRRNQIFQHIYADCLKSKIDYIFINCAKYFLKIANSQHICQVYQYLDCYGFKRIIPIIINNLHDEQSKTKFITSIVDRLYECENNIGKIGKQLENQASTLSTLLRAINYQKNPLKKFKQFFKEEDCLRQMMRFIIKNQQQINRAKLCDVVLADDNCCRTFLQELLFQRQSQQNKKKYGTQICLKISPFLDQILREIFYFINIKVSDKIYHLLQILFQVLSIKNIRIQKQWSQYALQKVFNPQNTSSPDTMFQFAYFILMIITQLYQKNPQKQVKKITQLQFYNRVKSFDPKFANNMKQYAIGVYNRLVQQPFSQQTRGILCKYVTVKKNNKNNTVFHPIKLILQNWQIIYQIFSNNKIEVNVLYRICRCLNHFPTICQPFFQLLLNRLADQNKQELKVSSSKLKKQQNILLFINNIMQEQPNCIGTSSWKYLFLREPQPVQGRLFHYSKTLTLSNFIWFVRQFCRQVRLSQNYNECLDLLSYNFHLAITNSQQKQRIHILNKQYSVYHQVEFIKGIFEIKDYQLAIILLDIIQVNVVTQKLIVMAMINIVECQWKNIQAQAAKEKQKIEQKQKDKNKNNQIQKNKQKQPQNGGNPQNLLDGNNKNEANLGEQQIQKVGQKQLLPAQGVVLSKIWTHLLTKILTISLNNPTLFQQFSTTLYQIPQLQHYYQVLNIQYAIESAFLGRNSIIDQNLTKKLQKFQQHIPQMHNTYSMMIQRSDSQLIQAKGLLEQFVHIKNIKQIVKHFKYFLQVQSVYTLLTNSIISNLQNRNESGIKLQQKSFQIILDILQQNNYLILIKLQNRLQPILGFVVAATFYLHQQKLQNIYKRYQKQLQNVAKLIIQKMNDVINQQVLISKKQQKQKQQQQLQQKIQYLCQTLPYFLHIYNCTYSYISPIYQIISIPQLGIKVSEIIKQSCEIVQTWGIIHKINKNYQYRFKIYEDLKKMQNQINDTQNKQNIRKKLFKLPPALLQQEFMSFIIAFFYTNIQNTKHFNFNWSILLNCLNRYLQIFKQLCHELYHKKPKQKHNKHHVQNKPKHPDITHNQQDKSNATHDSNEELQVLNQHIQYFKRILENVIRIFIDKINENQGKIQQIILYNNKKNQEKYLIRDIQRVLVKLIEIGLDYYDTNKKKMDVQSNKQDRKNYVYQIYQLLTNTKFDQNQQKQKNTLPNKKL